MIESIPIYDRIFSDTRDPLKFPLPIPYDFIPHKDYISMDVNDWFNFTDPDEIIRDVLYAVNNPGNDNVIVSITDSGIPGEYHIIPPKSYIFLRTLTGYDFFVKAENPTAGAQLTIILI